MTRALVRQAAGDAFLDNRVRGGGRVDGSNGGDEGGAEDDGRDYDGKDYDEDDDEDDETEAAERDRATLVESVQLPGDLEGRIRRINDGIITERYALPRRARKWGRATIKRQPGGGDGDGDDGGLDDALVDDDAKAAEAMQSESYKKKLRELETEEDIQEILRRFLHGHEDACGSS